MTNNFSILISVYSGTSVKDFKYSIASILKNSLLPSEVIVIVDGPINDSLNTYLTDLYLNCNLFLIFYLKLNSGLSYALNIGIDICSTNLIVRFDCDDICHRDRFKFLVYEMTNSNENVAIIGSNVIEFNEDYSYYDFYFKDVPLKFIDIKNYSKLRNPINHPSIIFRKDLIIKSGYYPNLISFEDYGLVVNVISSGYLIKNISQYLVFMRSNISQISRRRGLKYLINEIKFAFFCYNIRFFNFYEFIIFLLIRIPFRLLSKVILNFFYKNLLRN